VYRVIFNNLILLEHRAVNERGDLVLCDVVAQDHTPFCPAGALEHQHAFPEGGIDLVDHPRSRGSYYLKTRNRAIP